MDRLPIYCESEITATIAAIIRIYLTNSSWSWSPIKVSITGLSIPFIPISAKEPITIKKIPPKNKIILNLK